MGPTMMVRGAAAEIAKLTGPVSGCQKVPEKCSFGQLLPFNTGTPGLIIPDIAAKSGIWLVCEDLAPVSRGGTAMTTAALTRRSFWCLFAARDLLVGLAVVGEVVRHRRSTLQQRATADSHINNNAVKEIPKLTRRSGFNGTAIPLYFLNQSPGLNDNPTAACGQTLSLPNSVI
jgi:hypothetical protein